MREFTVFCFGSFLIPSAHLFIGHDVGDGNPFDESVVRLEDGLTNSPMALLLLNLFFLIVALIVALEKSL